MEERPAEADGHVLAIDDILFNSDEECQRDIWPSHPRKKEQDPVNELVDKQLQNALDATKSKP